jgi:uncharacterized membrane protein YdjX (TVP38/TMEM64 family)
LKKLFKKVVAYLKEFGRLTPIALATAVMPAVFGTLLIATIAYPLASWLRTNWEVGAILFTLGVIIFCGLSILATNIVGIIGGWAFGFELGIVVLITAVVSAATLSYLIHSRIVGDTLPHVFEHHPKAQIVYQALVGQSIWRTTLIIFLLRLSPAMPFALTNFLMASARVPLKSFIAGTFGGMLPRSTAVVLVGSGLSELSFDNPQEAWLLIFGIVATIVSIVFVTIVARRALERLTLEKGISTQAE